MIGFSPTEIVIALGALAVVALLLATILGTRKPKRVEKWEKAEIMRQLLALSEAEMGAAAATPSVRMSAPASKPAMRSGSAPLKATAKTTLPSRSKVR